MEYKEKIIKSKGENTNACIYKIENGCVIYRTTIQGVHTEIIEYHIPLKTLKETWENIVKVEDIIQWII